MIEMPTSLSVIRGQDKADHFLGWKGWIVNFPDGDLALASEMKNFWIPIPTFTFKGFFQVQYPGSWTVALPSFESWKLGAPTNQIPSARSSSRHAWLYKQTLKNPRSWIYTSKRKNSRILVHQGSGLCATAAIWIGSWLRAWKGMSRNLRQTRTTLLLFFSGGVHVKQNSLDYDGVFSWERTVQQHSRWKSVRPWHSSGRRLTASRETSASAFTCSSVLSTLPTKRKRPWSLLFWSSSLAQPRHFTSKLAKD